MIALVHNIGMVSFDLGRFRQLAFGGRALPDHPLQDIGDAQRMMAELQTTDPGEALAEITNWAASMNATDSFTPGRRARILMCLDEAARPRWRALTKSYLAPDGRPREHRDGDPAIPRAWFDAASEFANGFGIVLDALEAGQDEQWVERNLARVAMRNMRWLGRRLALAHILRLGAVGSIWERAHRLHRRIDELGAARTVLPVFDTDKVTSSLRQEYTRMMLFELGSPESLKARDIELTFRIAGRHAVFARLESAVSDETPFAIVPAGDARPALRRAIKPGTRPAPLYIATLQCLPRLRAELERDQGVDPGEPDASHGGEFTLRERSAMLKRLLDYWGPDRPQRRARRVALASPARIASGFEQVAELIPALEKAGLEASDVTQDLQLAIDDTTRTLSRARVRAASRVGPARVVDASNGGLGLAIRRGDARWVRPGILVAIMIEPSSDWIVGVLRRIFPVGDELRLGVQVLARQPRAVMLDPQTEPHDSAWEEAMKFEATFKERHRKGLLLEPQKTPFAAAELLLPPSLASPGMQFDVPLRHGKQRIRVVRMLDDGEHFQRVAFETLS